MSGAASGKALLYIVSLSAVIALAGAGVGCLDREPRDGTRTPAEDRDANSADAGTPDTLELNEARAKPRSDCYACHESDYRHARRHVDVKPTRCAVCHLETGWHPTQRNHPWPLTGHHAKADCFDCHVGNPRKFEETDDACVACHHEDYDNADYPGHDKFALTCEDCHSTKGWKPAKKPQKHKASEDAVETADDAVQPTTAATEQDASGSEPTVDARAATQATDEDRERAAAEASDGTSATHKAAPAATNQATTSKSTATKATTAKTASAKTTQKSVANATTKTATTTSAPKATSPASPATATTQPATSSTAPKTSTTASSTTTPPKTAAKTKPKHPESAFPISRGNHVDIECETCHSQAGKMGKANTDCVQCHKRSKYDRKHQRITDYPTGVAPLNFCVDCHTKGSVKPVARKR